MSQIAKDQVVEITYTLKDPKGNVIDHADSANPLAYLHGHSNIIPGLESELEGKAIGDKVQVTVQPANGYGERNDTLVNQVARDNFPADADITPGMQFAADTPDGTFTVTVTNVENNMVTVDANHPLAGVVLDFAVEVKAVRSATKEELEHGHVHGEHGHDHG